MRPFNRTMPAGLVAVTVACVPGFASALTIVPTFSSSVLNDPNTASIQATINTAIGIYAQKFADPITVEITFDEMNSGLGSSSNVPVYTVSYNGLKTAFANDATTANDAIALAHLPVSFTEVAPGVVTKMRITQANAKALGGVFDPGSDGTVSFNPSITYPPNPTGLPNYALLPVIEHEIDEILGASSDLGSSSVLPPDLFRFDASGNRSFTTSESAASYFSIDGGATLITRYNQTAGGDYGDFYSIGPHTPQVQDAFATPGANPALGNELILLDVIGYDLIPEPAALAALGLAGMALLSRRRQCCHVRST